MTWTPPPALVESVARAIGDVQLLTGGTFREMIERTPYARADYSVPRLLIDVARAALFATRAPEMRALLERVACAADLEQLAALNAAARKLLGEIDAKEGTEP